jgi:anti-sigma regulatory factor (Ser/Thr protein kinase)
MADVAASAPFILTSDIGELAALDQWFSGQVVGHRLPDGPAAELRVCLHEIVANIILHGSVPGQQCVISVRAHVGEAEIALVVEDNARPFNPLEKLETNVAETLDDAPIGGLGLHLVRGFTDRLEYEQQDGRNRLTLFRRLSGA